MRWLLIGYMFLFIERPFEVWKWLGDIHIERVYMLFTLAVWTVYPNKRWLSNPQHAAYAAFAAAVALCWGMSPWADKGQGVVEDWFKIVVFYGLLVTTVHDEEGLKEIVTGFLTVMALYLLHSFREFLSGRHTFRMGIARMIGVDTTLGDPNSFGASIIFALPLVTAAWKAGIWGGFGRFLLTCYVGLSSLCLLLTGSRGSLIGLVVWFLIVIWGTKYRTKAIAGFVVAAPLAFVALPESLQTRFETIINPEVGPANAKESGEGRINGLLIGLDLWAANPMNGIGPGAWRPATGAIIESHNLYGQLLGETGTLGGVTFLSIIVCFWINVRAVRRAQAMFPEHRDDLVFTLPQAVGVTVFLLLFMGNFGHNLFRFTWLWYGGFLIIARHCVAQRIAALSHEPQPAHKDAYDTELEPAAAPLPAGWVLHPPHGRV